MSLYILSSDHLSSALSSLLIPLSTADAIVLTPEAASLWQHPEIIALLSRGVPVYAVRDNTTQPDEPPPGVCLISYGEWVELCCHHSPVVTW